MDFPEIHYARSGDVAIAYQAVGEGAFDLVFVPTFANLVFPWPIGTGRPSTIFSRRSRA
jgi:hypothetical protein